MTKDGGAQAGRWWKLALVGLLLVGAALRFLGIDFGLPLQVHPDEGKVLSAALGFGSGDFNPHFFRYPTLLMYMLFAVFGAYYALGRALGWFADSFDFAYRYAKDPSTVIVLARCCVAAMGTATLGVVYLLGKRLGGRVAGIIAIALLALSFHHVADSHYCTTDVPSGLWCTLCMLFVVRWHQGRLRRDLALAGICAGLAASTRYNAALVGIAAIPAALSYTQVGLARRLAALVACGALCILAFAATSPYVLLDYPAFIADFSYSMLHAHGGHFGISGEISGWQAYALQSLPQGIGPAATAFAALGLLAALLRPRGPALGPALFCIGYFALMGSWRMTFDRFLMPILPGLCVFAALAIKGMYDRAPALGRTSARILLIGLVIAGSIGTLAATIYHDMLLVKTDTRVFAQNWVAANLHDGDAILMEEYGPQPRSNQMPPSRGGEAVVALKDRIKLRIIAEEPTYRVERFVEGLFPYDVEQVREQGIDAVFLSSYVYERYLAQPDEFPEIVRFYRELPSISVSRTIISPYKPGRMPPLPDQQQVVRRPFPMRTLYGPCREDMFERMAPGPLILIYQICPKGMRCRPLSGSPGALIAPAR
ncbi:MAG: glycosyltransferase family 39 protein [Candidatus Alcyoniella australis]|nr:glycosyltransferase family 39 protein [Candidatus Alcyoniella australis]